MSTKKMQRIRLGDLLLESGMISKEQLDYAIKVQRQTGRRIGEILIENRFITEENILGALEFQLGIPYMNLEQYSIDYNIASKVPESVARRYLAIAVGVDEMKRLKVAMKDPLNIFALDDLKLSTKMEIEPILASAEAILNLINQTYTSTRTRNIVDQVEQQIKEEVRVSTEKENEDNAPMVQLVNNILQRCILKGASDIHIEPFEEYVRIRLRVDGQLHELTRIKKEMINGITAIIKILSGLDISERRLPQDGRMSKSINEQQVDLRVSILPTIYGEKTVIRCIYRIGKELELEEIGFHPDDYVRVVDLLKNPHGIILLTGPTGSGKSTTMSAALKILNKENINIITVEDPVENMIEGINQITINTKIGLTFANALRSILRQDPDIIMIGEMRDSETSTIAIRAAITGHLVLSTLHTNDAASSIPRLIDMGTEAYMVGAAIKGVISQRLVRKICPLCRMEHQVTATEEEMYGIKEGSTVYKAKGCSACNKTGYKGRIAIHEVLKVDAPLQEMISAGNTSTEDIKSKAIERGMRTLSQNAIYNVLEGKTTMEEMLRITYEQ